jgi:uncharacterized membrane protein
MNENILIGEEGLFDAVFNDAAFAAEYYEHELKKLEVQSKAQDIAMRKEYADKTFALVCIYMVCVFLLIILACSPALFNMNDSVLITLLGTTTINVIGLFAIVMNYLFPKK